MSCPLRVINSHLLDLLKTVCTPGKCSLSSERVWSVEKKITDISGWSLWGGAASFLTAVMFAGNFHQVVKKGRLASFRCFDFTAVCLNTQRKAVSSHFTISKPRAGGMFVSGTPPWVVSGLHYGSKRKLWFPREWRHADAWRDPCILQVIFNGWMCTWARPWLFWWTTLWISWRVTLP